MMSIKLPQMKQAVTVQFHDMLLFGFPELAGSQKVRNAIDEKCYNRR